MRNQGRGAIYLCVYFRPHVTYPPQLEDTALTGRLQPGAHAAAGPVNYPGIGKWAGPPPLASARGATTFWLALSAICGGLSVSRDGAGGRRCDWVWNITWLASEEEL